ncbi:hypothetical protein MK280_13795 [Myxococcota bacterium]|nr:hypothetical protein [Myxococcota bacterium]
MTEKTSLGPDSAGHRDADSTAISVFWISGLAFALWAFAVLAQFELIPFVRNGWAFNLWTYLPLPARWALGIASFVFCFSSVRERAVRLVDAFRASLPGSSNTSYVWAAVLAVLWTGAAWVFREREPMGDSDLLAFQAAAGWRFVFQEPGASYWIYQAIEIGSPYGVEPFVSASVLSCLCLAPFFFLLYGAARSLLGEAGAPAAVALVLSAGMARVFAGHVEVYAPLLVAAAAYLWTAFAHMKGRVPGWWPALALGVTIWTHLSALMLVPSLMALPWLTEDRPTVVGYGKRWVRDGLVCAAPLAVFFLLLFWAGHTEDLDRAWQRGLEVAGWSQAEVSKGWWVRGWSSYPSIGTDVIFLSLPHLKYLVNAFTLLGPAAIVILVGCGFSRPDWLGRRPEGLFLAFAALPLLAYSCALRPFFGPLDWDLFALTVLVLFFWALFVAQIGLANRVRTHGLIVGIVFQLCFVGVPFLWSGVAPRETGGPFGVHEELEERELMKERTPPPPSFERWL